MSEEVRLSKLLAQHLGVGRRQADLLIEQQKVFVNGAPARLGQRVTGSEKIVVNGKEVQLEDKPEFIYLALNKPVGYVSSRKQQGDAPTIFSLLPKKYHHLYPVGRLDKESSGLLLLTNDGDFALRMTHPRYRKRKQYTVTLNTPLQPLHRQMISDFGVDLPDGKSQLQLERVEEGNDNDWIVIMHEGRNRQIRRTFSALGYEVTKLHRTHFGNYIIDGLKPGEISQIHVHPAA